jgi:hypothetical protein
LIKSIEYHNSARAKLLIEKGADINVISKDGLTALHMASITSNYPIAQLLVNKGADINARTNEGSTPLSFAKNSIDFSKFKDKIIDLLIKKGADIKAKEEGNDKLNYFNKTDTSMNKVGNCSKCHREVYFIPMNEMVQYVQGSRPDLIQAIAMKCPKCEALLCTACVHAANRKCPDCKVEAVRVT